MVGNWRGWGYFNITMRTFYTERPIIVGLEEGFSKIDSSDWLQKSTRLDVGCIQTRIYHSILFFFALYPPPPALYIFILDERCFPPSCLRPRVRKLKLALNPQLLSFLLYVLPGVWDERGLFSDWESSVFRDTSVFH